jgi:hypothetical protein
MLTALRVSEALALAEASRRRSRDEQAMVKYLGVGKRARRPADAPAAIPLLTPDTIDLAAFESDERQRLEDAIARLTPDARRELIAVVWTGQRVSLSFEAALRRTRRIPPPAQTGYLMGIRLERYVALGLERLGARKP